MSAHDGLKIVGGMVVGGRVRVRKVRGVVWPATVNQILGCTVSVRSDVYNQQSKACYQVEPESMTRAMKIAQINSLGSRTNGDNY